MWPESLQVMEYLDSCLYFMVAFQVGKVTPKYWPIGAGDFNVLTYCCLGSDTAEQ